MHTPCSDGSTPEIGFDPEAVLERDSRILLDPAFLATLHAELAGELDPDEQRTALLQMGFLHGLQDVTRALASTPDRGCHQTGPALAPPLRMPLRSSTDTHTPNAIRVEGSWPDQHEATAHLSAVGAGDHVVCYLSAGYTSGWLSGAFDVDLLAVEIECSATGADSCRFEAREVDAWEGDAVAAQSLSALPFEQFRALVRERFAREAGRDLPGEPGDLEAVERGAAAVHIWGPVMVLPYAGPDETLQAIELLARDPGAAEVTVIVLDLGGAIVDEAFGAMALEQLVQTAEAWGAETLFVDPSPLSDAVLADLEHPPLLTLKDLEPAIALAFQIARSQRRVA
ncbi:MAG: 4-vinyl reductase [Myxococcota bacterium]